MSNFDDNNDKDDKKQNDPFEFFKLSSEPSKDGKNDKNNKKKLPVWLILTIAMVLLVVLNIFSMMGDNSAIDFTTFKQYIKDGKIVEVDLGNVYFVGYGPESNIDNSRSIESLLGGKNDSRTTYKTAAIWSEGFLEFLDENGVAYKAEVKQNNFLLDFILNWILPFGFIFLMWNLLFKKIGGGMGGGMGSIFSAGSSRATSVEEGQIKTRFADVAGVDEAKEELVEVVDFLKSPKKYTEIGGKIPKGVLLVGPPGTGKTLLARAVAGEAGVPFFKISGSDFVEMFVGVGASRVRDLFKQAREKAPCIIFIDELDAIGKSRVNNLGGNDEREQTLNQLLVEMDGFDNQKGLILLAATNRPDVLDPALLRPGRFDRQVVVDRPDVKGREAILKIHSKNVKIEKDVDFQSLARATAGFAGADLANIVNEAALLAVRGGRKKVTMQDFDEAIEKTMVGLQKKNRVIKESERKIVAYHETGHALVAAFTEGSDPVHKISIIPRGVSALGYTLHRAEDESFLSTQKEMLAEVDCLLGGRGAEEVIFGEVSTGAANDIMRATGIIRRMITEYGMSDKFKNMTLGKQGGGYGYGSSEPSLVREYAETTQQFIDEEIARVMDERYNRVLDLLKSKMQVLEYIAQRLLEKETIEAAEFNDIVNAEANLAQKALANSENDLSSKNEENSSSDTDDSVAVDVSE
ncbi:MAG: ATP-dependent zinc metalloprotease FtsH [Spirochaetaceae bacterium]|nr:ATP-dependent zinc metalloprotease FtsH [Spirochaetaceae bacterium]